jgi:hypothetical protein
VNLNRFGAAGADAVVGALACGLPALAAVCVTSIAAHGVVVMRWRSGA